MTNVGNEDRLENIRKKIPGNARIGIRPVAALLGVATLLTASVVHADPEADRCGATKLKAASRYGQGVLACHAKAIRRGEGVDPACTGKATSRLGQGFDKAEAGGGCVTADDEASSAAALDADVDAILAALAPEATEAARTCASSKTKASGKQIRALLTCYAKSAARSGGPEADCFTKASEKLTKSFTKAEQKDGCTTTSDVAAIGALGTDAAGEQVSLLSPVCGDAITGPTQECETGDDDACPGLCDASCACVVPPDCGNGTAEPPEECDDGNVADGDGCSSVCLLEDTSALCAGVATTSGTAIDAVLVSNAFAQPMHATAPPLDPSRLFVVEREGRIRIVHLADDSVAPTPFLDMTDLTTTDGERGLLSMAFDPDYESNRRFFVYYTDNSGRITIARYQTAAGNPNAADESTAEVLLSIPHPGQSNHNGGQVAFGADGYLYAATGDGGGGGDPDENAQDDASLLGKMLRIDVDVDVPPYWAVPPTNPGYVDGTSELELVWAKGLRNPWRFSFDRETGDLVIADVGQGSLEEIDWQPAASTGGENYGWDVFEGTQCYEPDPAPMCPSPPTGFTMPIHEYSHAVGCSISGGFVYRGCAMPDLAGTYFYSDWCAAFLRTIEIVAGAATNAQDRTADAEDGGASLAGVISFGEDARGELYVVQQGGAVYRLQPE